MDKIDIGKKTPKDYLLYSHFISNCYNLAQSDTADSNIGKKHKIPLDCPYWLRKGQIKPSIAKILPKN